MSTDQIKRVLVFEVGGFAVLCDEVVEWHQAADASKTEGICRLVQSFHQLSRSMDSGALQVVKFDSPLHLPTPSSTKYRVNSFYQGLPEVDQLSLASAAHGQVMVAVFFTNQANGAALAQAVTTAFTQHAEDALAASHHLFAQHKGGSPREAARVQEAITDAFRPFHRDVLTPLVQAHN